VNDWECSTFSVVRRIRQLIATISGKFKIRKETAKKPYLYELAAMKIAASLDGRNDYG
jgi:hypothetical protein